MYDYNFIENSTAYHEELLQLKGKKTNSRATKEDAMPDRKSLRDIAKENPTQLGDPVSLKAETSDNEPTEHDRGAGKQEPTLKQRAEKNPSMLGDPVSLKAETTDKDPVDHDNGPSGKEERKKDSKL